MLLDLNADLGEGADGLSASDAALLGVVTSANVACGFHAGDAATMLATCRAASERGVAVGAHVSYRDRANFGRTFLDLDPSTLADDVTEQLTTLAELAGRVGVRVTYVKPHGALYNAIAHHEEQAAAVVRAVAAFGRLALVGLPGSVALRLADAAGLESVGEAFADRAYSPDGTLVPRSEPGAVLHDADAIAARVVRFARTGTFTAVDGSEIAVPARSLCVHGDTPDAVAIARAVRRALLDEGVGLAPFAPTGVNSTSVYP